MINIAHGLALKQFLCIKESFYNSWDFSLAANSGQGISTCWWHCIPTTISSKVRFESPLWFWCSRGTSSLHLVDIKQSVQVAKLQPFILCLFCIRQQHMVPKFMTYWQDFIDMELWISSISWGFPFDEVVMRSSFTGWNHDLSWVKPSQAGLWQLKVVSGHRMHRTPWLWEFGRFCACSFVGEWMLDVPLRKRSKDFSFEHLNRIRQDISWMTRSCLAEYLQELCRKNLMSVLNASCFVLTW